MGELLSDSPTASPDATPVGASPEPIDATDATIPTSTDSELPSEPEPIVEPATGVDDTVASPSKKPTPRKREPVLSHERDSNPIMTRSRAAASGHLFKGATSTRGSFGANTGCIRKLSSTSTDPKSRKEAMCDDATGWLKAERNELNNHKKNNSWKYISRDELPAGRRLVRLIWVYKRKRDGSLKARLCVQGCSQVPGIDYDQTFCGALRATSLRVLCAAAAQYGMSLRRWDFVAAFLQGSLEEGEVVYCQPPPGYEKENLDSQGRTMICQVVKPVYGMVQAGRRWQRSLYPWLRSQGFSPLHSDPNIFVCRDGDEMLVLGCYVDTTSTTFSCSMGATTKAPSTTLSLLRSRRAGRWKTRDQFPIC